MQYMFNLYIHHNTFGARRSWVAGIITSISSSSPCSLAGWGPSHLVASSTFIVNVLHLPLTSAVVIHSWPFVPALSRSRLTLSFYRSFGLPLLLLPPSSAFHALFDSLSSPILCTCPAHLIQLPATFIFRCLFMPISSLNSFIFPLSSWVTLHILRTQLLFLSSPDSFGSHVF